MRARFSLLLVVVATVVAAGCHNVAPPGAAPLRYRDPVFSAVTKTSGVTYGGPVVDQDGQTDALVLDVYQPTGDTNTHRPAIVWVHGGGFNSGNRTSPEIVDEATTFAKKGYVNVSIEYRLTSAGCSASAPVASCVFEIVDAQHDAQAAVRFLRKNAAAYGIDPTRIAIGGTSAGAITAINVGANSEDPGVSGNPGFSSSVRAAVALSGAKLGGAPQTLGDAPSLLFHGSSDFVVPYQWAVNTQKEAADAGLVSYLTTYPGEGHVPYLNHHDEILTQTTNFLYWMLDLTHASP
jgi:acetyl esterase/lipase